MYCIFTELFPPSSTWKTVGGVAHTAPQVEEECDYPSSTCSFKSAAQTWIFHGGTIWKRFQTYWHISCLAGYVRSLWDVLTVESPVAPEDGFGCVLECVAPADSGVNAWHRAMVPRWALLTLEQLRLFLSSPVLEGSHIALRVSAAPQLCTYSAKSCLGGLLPPLFSIKAQTHVVVAAVIMAQSEVWHFWRKYIGKKLEMYKVSHKEGAGLRVRTYGNACVCVYVCLRVHTCACTVSLCTHICTCFGLYMAMRMSQTTEAGRLSASVCGNFKVMWCLCTTCQPLLFVLITERFTWL